MNVCASDKKKNSNSSLRELYLIQKSTYHALLSKLTPIEKGEIDKLNSQTLLPTSSDYDSPPPTEVQARENNQTNEIDSTLAMNERANDHEHQSENLNTNVSSVIDQPKTSVSNDVNNTNTVSDPSQNSNTDETSKSQHSVHQSSHKQPHLVSLNSVPSVLVTHPDEELAKNPNNLKISTLVTENKTQKSKRKQCPVCKDMYATSFTLLRHLSSAHPESDAAKAAWEKKRQREAKARKKINTFKPTSERKDSIASSSNTTKATTRTSLKRKRSLDDADLEDQEVETESKKRPITKRKLRSTQETPSDTTTNNKGRPKRKLGNLKSTPSKIIKSVAPKRKAGKLILSGNTGIKKIKRRANTQKIAKYEDDDEYEDWTN